MKRVTSTLALLLLCFSSFGQTTGGSSGASQNGTVVSAGESSEESSLRNDYLDNITVYYRFDSAEVDPTYLTNSKSFEMIHNRLADSVSLAHLDSIMLSAISSPEGHLNYNKVLSRRRADAMSAYLTEKYPHISGKLRTGYSGEDWDGLRRMVVSDLNVPDRDKVLAIIDTDIALDTKEWRLKKLGNGDAWEYITDNILPYLRYGASAIFHFDSVYLAMYNSVGGEKVVIPHPEQELPETTYGPVATFTPYTLDVTKPVLALKTNLLFDAASVLNVEVEVPIGNRWSIAGEWIFPWWTTCGNKGNDWTSASNRSRHTLEILNANIEGRYWFGDRESRPVLTGWNLGLYAGGGLYDLEWRNKGYQGEFFLAAGLSGGYAHTILEKWVPSGNLRMEYTVGVGYLQTDYRYYEEHWGIDDSWHTLREYNGRYSYFGPTRARISLVWLLNKTVKGGQQ